MQTGPWICDSCGRTIEAPEDGYVEWLSSVDNDRGFGLRLVHHKPASPRNTKDGCQYNETYEYSDKRVTVRADSLKSFLGDDGLMDLLELIPLKELPVEEIVEMIKRLHIANYEQARPFLESAISQGAIRPNMLQGFYTQGQLEDAIAWAEGQRGE